MKLLILLASVAMTWGMVAAFGWISIAVCFVLALGSLVFSSGQAEEAPQGPVRERDEHFFDATAASHVGH